MDSCYSVSDSKPMSSTTDTNCTISLGGNLNVSVSDGDVQRDHSEMFGYDPILTSSVFPTSSITSSSDSCETD